MEKCGYRIVLSIDGGGIRGIIPLVMLDHIEANFRAIGLPMVIPDIVDYFVGSSTGTVISGALMLKDDKGGPKFTVRSILDMYIHRGKQIFNKENGASTCRYAYPFRLVLDANFGDLCLRDLTHNFTFLSYDLVANQPYYFTNSRLDQSLVRLSDAMMACSAVPGYFPPFKYGDLELADGMLTAKNPTRIAYENARKLYPNDKLLVISLGTGQCTSNEPDFIDMEMIKVHAEMKSLRFSDPKLYYFRLQPDLLLANDRIDDTSDENIAGLVHDSVNYLQAAQPKFSRLFDLLKIKLAG
jgi:patatin-like phospholipase/acyl hydrolase